MRDGKPVAVLLDIEAYLQMLERLEEFAELTALEELRKKTLDIGNLETFTKKDNPEE